MRTNQLKLKLNVYLNIGDSCFAFVGRIFDERSYSDLTAAISSGCFGQAGRGRWWVGPSLQRGYVGETYSVGVLPAEYIPLYTSRGVRTYASLARAFKPDPYFEAL